MDLDKAKVCDIEAIGFLDKVKKKEDLHVLSVSYKNGNDGWSIKSTRKDEDIKKVVSNPDNVLVFHNGISYDKPALIQMGWEFNAEIIDTLPISYYLYSELDKHGLEAWGERFGVKKPEIEDWEGLSYEEYKHRCEEDVKINTNLWVKILSFLRELYDTDEEIIKVIRYLNFKAECLYIQSQNRILIDLPQCQKNLTFLEGIIEEKKAELETIMPKVPIKAKRNPPATPYNKDGSLSATGIKWFNLLEDTGLPVEMMIRSYVSLFIS